MKKARLITVFMVVFLLTVLLVACGGSETTTTETTTTAKNTTTLNTTTTAQTTTTPVTTAPNPTSLSSLKINGVDISEYVIVYAESPHRRQASIKQYAEFFPVWDFDHETADRLAALIKEVVGVELRVYRDTAVNFSTYEILVGETSRKTVGTALSYSSLESDDYKIAVAEGTKLAICGGEFGTTYHAIDYIEELFASAIENGNYDFEFASDYSKEGTYHLTRIGTIGDSITEGVGSTNSATFSYPAQLGRYLWKDALVFNFGRSGKTMRDDFNDAYTKTDAYTNAVNAAAEIDVFTIMLGTNDSNRDRSWDISDNEKYNAGCKGIIDSLLAKNEKLEFVICNCPAYFGNDGFGSTTVRRLAENLVKSLGEEGYTTSFFNMYNVTKTMSAYYPDSLHPDNTGHMKMAEAFSEFLAEYISNKNSK